MKVFFSSRTGAALLAAALLGGCGHGADTAALPPPAQDLTLVVAPAAIAAGEPAVLSWRALHASRCIAAGDWSGERSAIGRESVSPAVPGVYRYELSCSGPGGSGVRVAELRVSEMPAAVRLSFGAEPAQLALGASSRLSWKAEEATACTASGAWDGAREVEGTATVTPATPGIVIYQLHCIGAGAPADAVVQLEVLPVADDFAEARRVFAALKAMEQGCCASAP